MKTIADRANIAKQWKGKVVPRVKILLVKVAKESRACRLTPVGRGIYEVIEGATQFTVDILTHITVTVWHGSFLESLASMLKDASLVRGLSLNHMSMRLT